MITLNNLNIPQNAQDTLRRVLDATLKDVSDRALDHAEALTAQTADAALVAEAALDELAQLQEVFRSPLITQTMMG